MYDLKQAPRSCLVVVKPFKFHQKKEISTKKETSEHDIIFGKLYDPLSWTSCWELRYISEYTKLQVMMLLDYRVIQRPRWVCPYLITRTITRRFFLITSTTKGMDPLCFVWKVTVVVTTCTKLSVKVTSQFCHSILYILLQLLCQITIPVDLNSNLQSTLEGTQYHK